MFEIYVKYPIHPSDIRHHYRFVCYILLLSTGTPHTTMTKLMPWRSWSSTFFTSFNLYINSRISTATHCIPIAIICLSYISLPDYFFALMSAFTIMVFRDMVYNTSIDLYECRCVKMLQLRLMSLHQFSNDYYCCNKNVAILKAMNALKT